MANLGDSYILPPVFEYNNIGSCRSKRLHVLMKREQPITHLLMWSRYLGSHSEFGLNSQPISWHENFLALWSYIRLCFNVWIGFFNDKQQTGNSSALYRARSYYAWEPKSRSTYITTLGSSFILNPCHVPVSCFPVFRNSGFSTTRRRFTRTGRHSYEKVCARRAGVVTWIKHLDSHQANTLGRNSNVAEA